MGVYKAHSVPSGFAIAALNTLGSSVRLGAVTDLVSRLITMEAISSFLIRAAAGIA